MKNFSFILLILLFSAIPLSAVPLRWDIAKGERIEMVKTAGVKYYINSSLKRIYEERNIIDLTCTDKSDRVNRVNGVFSLYERDYGEEVFKLTGKFVVDFLIEPKGNFIVRKNDYMPNLRHIPSFPEKDVNPGDNWVANGELVIDNFSRAFSLTFPVEYRFLQLTEENGRQIAVISYHYNIDVKLSGNYPSDFPVAIAGKNDGLVFWDIKSQKPKNIQDNYRIIFLFASGGGVFATAEFAMDIKTENSLYKNYTDEEKQKEKENLQKELPEGVDSDVDKRGIVVRMGDLLFDFDSYALKKDTEEKLRQIADIIKKKYPDREIIVEGHTDNIGEKDYNYSLSEKRAKTVAEYLKGKLGHDKFSYKGYGSQNPLADNSTEEGRKKNRRVEIIIKLN
ncbi:MAG TPA: OmpA family protein [Spirochaetota bacterium]|jgi:outer membrane protein OmpA-like peptidoglycan-associated protein|nr:OmpA family protein [Spirochaetota bacterium]HPX90699.1 OmpA family protein [Spirochaetota bacterium]